MSEPRVIRADYSSWRPVSGRKVLQLVFEVPIEQTEQVMLMLGVPMPGESKWCAIALLGSNGSASGSENIQPVNAPKSSEATEAQDGHHGETPSRTPASIVETGISETQEKARKPFASLPLSQQAAMRTEDKDFQLFLEHRGPIHDQESYADVVRAICGVESRANIKLGTQAATAWMELEGKYQDYLTDRKYAEMRK